MLGELTFAGPRAAAPDAATEPQIAQVLAAVDAVLGPEVIGAYLYGSSVLGGLRPRSDLDILVVARRATTHTEKRRLVESLLAISRPAQQERGRPIELTIVVQAQVRPWRYPPPCDFQYGDWLRAEFERGEGAPWSTTEMRDLASLLTLVHLANAPLVGPPPAQTLDQVPPADYVRAIVGDMDTLMGDLAWDTANVLLTLARIWSTVATATIRPKDVAADWALVRLPPAHRPALARARAIYLGTAEDRWEDASSAARVCAAALVEAISRATTPEHG